MLSLRRICFALLWLSCTAGLAAAQYGMNGIPMTRPSEDTQPAEMRELVSKYCRLDYEGARLNPQAWPKFAPLVWWKTPPEYSKINVIARYAVDPDPVQRNGKYTVSVHYRLLGTFDLKMGYVPEAEGAMQDVDFRVSAENSEWRIADAENTLPHPSRAAMLKWLNEKIGTTEDEALKGRYQDALKQLQAQSASPFAK